MAIRFVLGGSGTGKTRYLYQTMIEQSMRDKETPVLFILPEQANMAAEQDMIAMHPKGGTMDISIVSFTRLAYKVFDELNIHTRDVLDDYGKSMLLMKLLRQHKEELTYYGSMTGKPGFVDELKSILSEFYQYRINDQVLERVLAGIRPEKSLYHKLSDLRILMRAFDEAMADSYMVTEQILTLLGEVIGDSKLIQNACVYFDGFTGFTPVQYKVIEEMMCAGCDMVFAFTMDADLFGDNTYGKQELFSLGKCSVDRLCQLAKENRIPVLPHVAMRTNYRLMNAPALQHLEKHIFRFPLLPYEEETDQIQILTADNPLAEAGMIACLIRELVMRDGYSYRDFAIITGDLMTGSSIWKQAMERMGIPYFLDASELLARNPIAVSIELLLRIFVEDFSYKSVFAFLKNGFPKLEAEGVCKLENYVRKYGVRGYSWWKKPFRGGVPGLGFMNQTRQEFMELLEPVTEIFTRKQAPAKEYIQAIYNFMSTNGMAEELDEKRLQLEQAGKLREAKAYEQVYAKFVAVLDKTMDILAEEEITREDFVRILKAGVSDVQLGMIPSTLDQVVIGDMERTRLQHVRVLFVAGVNEGILPADDKGNRLLVDRDRQQLKELQVDLAPDGRDSMYLQQFYLYLQITQPSERLIVSYRMTDMKGTVLRPSYYIGRLQALYPRMVQQHREDFNNRVLTEQDLIPVVASQMERAEMDDASALHLAMERRPEQYTKLLEGYLYNNRAGVLDRAIAGKLYGDHMLHSVSRLETYSACAYHFFLQFGLKLAKREEYKVESNNIGTILHAVMEHFFKGVKEGSILPEQMQEAELDRLIGDMVLESAREENETIFESSYRNRHQLEMLIRIARRNVKNLLRHLQQGGMQPAYFEKQFSPEDRLSYIRMVLEEDMQMELRGIIDRVDIKETEQAVYVKVIDYKSGAKDIDFVKLYEGKQLQLTVYMSVMLELLKRQYPDKDIIPTGMYYYHIYDPIVETEPGEDPETERIRASRLSGLVNSNEESLELMDGKTGQVVPVRYLKDGGLHSQNASLATYDELMTISQFVRDKMIHIGNDIVRGQIEMNPEKGKINSPCNFCDYRSICRFEPGVGGNLYHVVDKETQKNAKNIVLKKEDA